jgi:hypothetical protein
MTIKFSFSDKVWTRILELGANQESTTLEISPTLLGERHSPQIRGSASNIDPSNLALGSVTRALCQGVIANLLQYVLILHFWPNFYLIFICLE